MQEFYSGVRVVENFVHMDELYKKKVVSLRKAKISKTFPNMLLVLKAGKNTALAIVKDNQIELIPYNQRLGEIESRNKEQDMAIRLLSDPGIECVTITGCAGSGKTLLALAFAVGQLRDGKINKVVLCKNFTPIGREIGFLKGDMEDKVRPWLGNFYDNFEILGMSEYEIDRMNSYENQKHHPGRIEISPITYMQGRSISNAVIIIDEVQNLDANVVKQLLTRPAENCKIILLGDPDQIFEKGVQNGNNGLIAAVEAGKEAGFVGHLHMIKSERSRLAEWYSKNL